MPLDDIDNSNATPRNAATTIGHNETTRTFTAETEAHVHSVMLTGQASPKKWWQQFN